MQKEYKVNWLIIFGLNEIANLQNILQQRETEKLANIRLLI